MPLRPSLLNRKEDKDIIAKWYSWATPYIQMVGFVILCSFIGGKYYNQFEAQAATIQAHETRLVVLESSSDKINQKLDDIIEFLGVPTHVR